MQPTQQRLRVTFAKGESLRYISHLNLMRAWVRALRRAGVPLAYSHGFNPRPKVTFASPLAVGFTGEAEIMDIVLTRPVALRHFIQRLQPHLPPGLEIKAVEEVYHKLPALPTQVRAAEYRVTVEGVEPEDVQRRIEALLAQERLPRRRREREYDLRPLILALWVETGEAGVAVGMRLRASPQGGTGRPDEVMDALGLTEQVRGIHRVRLVLAADPKGS